MLPRQKLPDPGIQMFRDIFDASPIGIAIENREGQPLFANPALCSMLGLSEEELRHKHCTQFSPPEDSQKDWGLFEQLRAGSINHYQVEKRYFRQDGTLIWGRLSVSLLHDTPSTFVVAMLEDITNNKKLELERKRSEAALSESEERLRLAVKAGRMFAYSWDAATDVIELSGESAEILGIDGTKVKRSATAAMVHPDDKDRLEAALAKLTVENPNLHETYRIIRRDGAVIWLERNSRAYFDDKGKVQRLVGMIVDVTERKQSEEKLRESEEKFRSVFQGAGVGIVILSPEGRFFAANPSFCGYLGYTEQELLEQTIQSVTLAEDWPAFSQRLNETSTEGRSFQKLEKRFVHRSGNIVWTEIMGFLVRTHDSHPNYLVAEVLDITKRKQAEEALSTVNRTLIEAQEQERKRIGRDLHDDINQRLALLAVELDQLQENLAESPANTILKLREFRERIGEISTGVQSISRQLHVPQLEYLGIVATMRNFCTEFADKRKVEIDFSEDNIPEGVSHEVSLCLFRVLQEALHNATKHSQVRRFEVALGCSTDQLHLMITDRGKGFDAEAAVGSAGLGLISMRERVRIVKGTFAIDSKPQRGTIIRVSVPLRFEHAGDAV